MSAAPCRVSVRRASREDSLTPQRGPSRNTGSVRGIRLGMRWWLSAVFVAIAAITAVLIASDASRQASHALAANAASIAVGETVSAGFAVEHAVAKGDLGHELVSIGGQHGLALFVFGRDGRIYAEYGLRSVAWADVPRSTTAATLPRSEAARRPLSGSRSTVAPRRRPSSPTRRGRQRSAPPAASFGTRCFARRSGRSSAPR